MFFEVIFMEAGYDFWSRVFEAMFMKADYALWASEVVFVDSMSLVYEVKAGHA